MLFCMSYIIDPSFPNKSFVREKSDDQGNPSNDEGNQYVVDALHINATIRAYQVHLSK